MCEEIQDERDKLASQCDQLAEKGDRYVYRLTCWWCNKLAEKGEQVDKLDSLCEQFLK